MKTLRKKVSSYTISAIVLALFELSVFTNIGSNLSLIFTCKMFFKNLVCLQYYIIKSVAKCL